MEAYALSIVGVLTLCLVSILLAVFSGYSKGRAGTLSGRLYRQTTGTSSIASTVYT